MAIKFPTHVLRALVRPFSVLSSEFSTYLHFQCPIVSNLNSKLSFSRKGKTLDTQKRWVSRWRIDFGYGLKINFDLESTRCGIKKPNDILKPCSIEQSAAPSTHSNAESTSVNGKSTCANVKQPDIESIHANADLAGTDVEQADEGSDDDW